MPTQYLKEAARRQKIVQAIVDSSSSEFNKLPTCQIDLDKSIRLLMRVSDRALRLRKECPSQKREQPSLDD